MRDLLSVIEGLPQSRLQEPIERPGEGLPADSSPSPMQIGRYEVFEHLAPGAFGFVLRAFDPVFRRPCALKVPNPNVLAEPKKRQRFLAEARALERLGHPAPHPNVVRVYDADECGGICYIAMELCEPGSLADWMGNLPEGRLIPKYWAADLVKQIACGVQHAHERGIYHRDLKPANILLTHAEATPTGESQGYEVSPDFPRFRPKVADFGLAKILGDGEQTVDGAMIGTRPYMAPEQIRGELASVGPATDIWALGVILYELLTRRRPFEGPDEATFLRQICAEDPAPPRTLRRDLPRGLETVCLKSLGKDPRDRYLSPSELANDLERVLRNMTPLGRPAPYWKRILGRVKRHPVRAALLGLTAATCVGAAEYLDYRWRGDAVTLLKRLESSTPADWPGLVPRLSARYGPVARRLRALLGSGNDYQQLAAALVLTRDDPESYFGTCDDRLLKAPPEAIAPAAWLLNDRISWLVPRLEAAVAREAPPGEADRDRFERRRANAACALAVLGRDERIWPLLRPRSDPRVRTFLIHTLGPAGVAPARLVEVMEDPRTDPKVRMALVQSLDSVPDAALDPPLRARVTQWLLDRYQNDPHAGVHGSVKWLLRRWRRGPELERIDCKLAGTPPGPGFQWRISSGGLTLITVDDRALDRIIEVSDTEITGALYRPFNESRPPEERSYSAPQISRDDSCPVNGASYFDGAAFCNWLTRREGFPEQEACYLRTDWCVDPTDGTRHAVHEPAADHRDRGGFRLPTSREFGVFCAAGTSTRRYHGDSDFLFDRYAGSLLNSDGQTHPVASLIPNDFGLFDTLGNAWEWCDGAEPRDERGVVGDLQGGFSAFGPVGELDRTTGMAGVIGYRRTPYQGFRVVRTKQVRKLAGRDGGLAMSDPES